MSDGQPPPPRPPRDFQDLLRLCMETVPQDPEAAAAADQQLHPLDPERRQWLSAALDSMSTDTVREMCTNLDTITNGLRETTDDGLLSMETVERIQAAIESLIDRTGNLDSARDFCTIGGFQVFPLLFAAPVDDLKASGCELLAEVTQNEPECQQRALDSHLLAVLVRLLDDQSMADKVRVKALYAISCIVRANGTALDVFERQLDGLSVLINTVANAKDSRLRVKASFLMSALCQKPEVCASLYGLGALDQLIGGLVDRPHDSTHEYLLAALYALVSAHQPSRDDCRRTDRQVKSFLKQRIQELTGTEEFVEELDYCRRLFDLLFVDNDLPDSER